MAGLLSKKTIMTIGKYYYADLGGGGRFQPRKEEAIGGR
jgi:hypothetical protein